MNLTIILTMAERVRVSDSLLPTFSHCCGELARWKPELDRVTRFQRRDFPLNLEQPLYDHLLSMVIRAANLLSLPEDMRIGVML